MTYVEGSLQMDGIWQLSGEEPTKGHLLVVLHGRGDSAGGFEWLQSALNLPDLSLLLLNAPDPYYTGFSWYDLPPNQGPGIFRSRKFLDEVFTGLFAKGFAPERCLLLGFSQGCLMTLEFGGRMAVPLAGYVGISGYCFDPKALISEAHPAVMKAPWLVTHGTSDEVLAIERTREQIQELIAGGF